MHTILRNTLLLMLLPTAGAVCAAEELLSLDESIAIAVASAPQAHAARAAIDVARSAVTSAGRLPSLALIAGLDNVPTNGADAWSLQRDFMTMRTVGLMQEFPNRRKRRTEKDYALSLVNVAESAAAVATLELTQSVAQAWVARYAAEAALTNLQRLQAAVSLQVELARVAVASGNATVSEALEAQATSAELEDRLLEARSTVAAASAELFRWLGDAAHRPLAAPPSFATLPAGHRERAVPALRQTARTALDARISAARSEIAVASAASTVDWSAELNYAWRGHGFSDMVSLQFQVAVPFFAATRFDPQVAARRAAVTQLEAEREARLSQLGSDIETRQAQWHTTLQRIELYERERLPLARQRSELALAAMRAGRSTVQATVAALAEQVEIEGGYAELLQALGAAWAYLRFLPGAGEVP